MDVQKQLDYWRTGAQEDMEAAGILSEKERFRHALFFAHLALEKSLKAHVVVHTKRIPPRIHNLMKLAEIADLSLPPILTSCPCDRTARRSAENWRKPKRYSHG